MGIGVTDILEKILSQLRESELIFVVWQCTVLLSGVY